MTKLRNAALDRALNVLFPTTEKRTNKKPRPEMNYENLMADLIKIG